MKAAVIEAFGVTDPKWSSQIVSRSDFNIRPESVENDPPWIYVLKLEGKRGIKDFEKYIGAPISDRDNAGQIDSAEKKILTAMLTDAMEET
ncbi:MAG: hypothetical protein KAJ19_18135 [Gammaproteobacteria bacterium]|nr:hypothetical protein [Gammaproteobacteria bacterium]